MRTIIYDGSSSAWDFYVSQLPLPAAPQQNTIGNRGRGVRLGGCRYVIEDSPPGLGKETSVWEREQLLFPWQQ